MKKGVSSIFALFLLFVTLNAGAFQSKKVYELIYEDLQRLTQYVLNLEQKIEQNREEIEALRTILEELLSLNRHFQSEQASLKEDQKQIPPQFQAVMAKLDGLTTRLNNFSEELLEIKTIVLTPPEPPVTEEAKEGQTEVKPAPDTETEGQKTEKEEKKTGEEAQAEEAKEEQPQTGEIPLLSPQEVYNIAYSDYLKGNYQLAVDGFKLFLEQFSDTPVADDAAYWIGECYFSQRQYEEAAARFTELILYYPEGDKIPAAYLKKGICLMELGKKEEALSVFKLLISKYPFEEETRIAQEKIKEIRKVNA
jgi:tol-pal system protein YbgF